MGVTKTMQFFLVTCFLMITFLSQGMDGKKYLIKTGDEDDVEPYITNTLIKFDPNEDVDGIEILMKNLKGKNLKNFLNSKEQEWIMQVFIVVVNFHVVGIQLMKTIIFGIHSILVEDDGF